MKSVDTVLLYAPKNSVKVQRMKPALIRMGIRIKMINDEMLTENIGTLLGMNEEEITSFVKDAAQAAGHELIDATKVPEIDEEVMVMFHFTNEKIDRLLQNFKKAGVSKVSLKAIVTPNNITWTFGQLAVELMKEHETYTNNK